MFWLGALALWQLAVEFEAFNLVYLPSPLRIIVAVPELIVETPFLRNTWHTISVSLLGWALALFPALMFGTAIGTIPRLWTWTMATVEVLRAVPAVAMVPAAVLVFGLSSRMELAIVLFGCFWPVVISTANGLHTVPQGLRDVADTLRISRLRRIVKVNLPAAFAQIFVGARISLTLALILAVVAEIIANPAGLGYQIVFEQQALRPDLMFGCLIAIGLLGVVFNSALVSLSRICLPGLTRATERR